MNAFNIKTYNLLYNLSKFFLIEKNTFFLKVQVMYLGRDIYYDIKLYLINQFMEYH